MSKIYSISNGDNLLSRTIGEVLICTLVGKAGRRSTRDMAELLSDWSEANIQPSDIAPALAMFEQDGWVVSDPGSACGFVLSERGAEMTGKHIEMLIQAIDRDAGVLAGGVFLKLVEVSGELTRSQEKSAQILTSALMQLVQKEDDGCNARE